MCIAQFLSSFHQKSHDVRPVSDCKSTIARGNRVVYFEEFGKVLIVSCLIQSSQQLQRLLGLQFNSTFLFQTIPITQHSLPTIPALRLSMKKNLRRNTDRHNPNQHSRQTMGSTVGKRENMTIIIKDEKIDFSVSVLILFLFKNFKLFTFNLLSR